MIYEGKNIIDLRGNLKCVNDFNFSGIKRFYHISNHSKNFIRAWHGHEKEAKYVYVPSGSALVGAIPMPSHVYMDEMGGDVEIIPGDKSPEKFVLSSKSPKVLHIPAGYCNGFMTLEENTIVQFFSTSTLEDSLGDDVRFDFNKWDIWEEDFR